MRIVVVTTRDRGLASRFLRRPFPPAVEVVGVLRDLGGPTSRKSHYRTKLRKLKRLGPTIVPLAFYLRRVYAAAEADGVPALEDLDVPVVTVASANSAVARKYLEELAPDVLLTLGSRYLEPRTFSMSQAGAINVHHGAVPQYRGGPPIFWEIANGEADVGYIVHAIDQKLDHGPIYASGSTPLQRRGSVGDTIRATLPPHYERSLDTLMDVLGAVASGTASAATQPASACRPNTSPRMRDYWRARAAL
jgi:folate-dependent phosphoribosylglycinamide formyltransferase PurN